MSRLPALAEAGPSRHQFLDLDGSGHLDCVVFRRPGSGFYKRTGAGGWESFAFLPGAPNVDWDDPNLRFIDVDGDGFSDVLITDHEAITCYPSRAQFGFGEPNRVPKATDEEKGPAVVFADSTQSIFLADMSGDGLSDIVRVRNGEVCYWPNLGYGRFGAKVDMDQAPWFDAPDQFNARRVRLADVDGSGVADIVYLSLAGVSLYFNQAGNAWSQPTRIADYPPVDDLASIQVIDLLGNGTSCLVWTSALPGDAGRSIRYVDMMGSQKPYLLVRCANNLGAETRITYAPSTAFYLADRAAGRPWATRLPFPVQVVERVETLDWVSRNRFVTRSTYHHGYFDGIEREFRGFGMVEQYDTVELGVLTQTGAFPNAVNIDAASYVPPVLTKTWYHTGVYPLGPRVTRIYDAEYFSEPGLTTAQIQAMLLPDSELPEHLSGNEIHEAIRSLKGGILRQEVYACDGTAAAGLPYSVSERNYTVCRLQPFGGNRHAVFYTHARESIDFHYERKLYAGNGPGQPELADPRVTHSMTLQVDPYGNEVRSAAIAYGRRYDELNTLLTSADQAIQQTLHVTYTESVYTNAILEADDYRTPLPAEKSTYELIKVVPDSTLSGVTDQFGFDELAGKIAQADDGLHDLRYEDVNATGATQPHPYQRIIEHVRTLYRKNDLSAGLLLGTVESLALPLTKYQLAFTPGLVALYQRGSENLLPTPASVLGIQGGYVVSDDLMASGLFPATDPSGIWWIVGGQSFYSPNPSDTPAQELQNAQSNFFLPLRFRDPFGNDTIVTYDAYPLLLVQVQDAVDNIVSANNDYRVLQAALMTDANGNQSAVAFDALGLVAGTAIMGKSSENLGDTLTGFVADLTQAQIDLFFADPQSPVSATLGNATSRIVYDIGRFARSPSTPAAPNPVYAATIMRETHVNYVAQGLTSKLQVSVSYSDGFGRAIQRKGQAEPGPLVPGGATVNPRWVGSGWIIFNNKGKPVRQYEPFFDDTHDFEFGVAVGVSPTLFYDPLTRVVATLQPDQSWSKVVFDPWRQDTWDGNDTVLIADPSADADVGPYFKRIPASDYSPTWYSQKSTDGVPWDEDAAQKASVHANTPTTAYFDTLGRTFLTLAFNRYLVSGAAVESHDRTFVNVDVEGNQRSITDALGRTIMTYDYDMLGNRIRSNSVDAGERWMLNDVAGKPLMKWDSREHRFRYEYDAARRPTDLFVQTGTAAELLAEQTVYGEGEPNASQDQLFNLRGRVYQQFDEAGVATNNLFDCKGNLLSNSRELLSDYKDPVDWSASPALTGETFTSSATFDALNRPVTLTTPDLSVMLPTYNEASLLQQINVQLRGVTPATPFVTDIDYNAKGQRDQIVYGNGAQTAYTYDKNTFRLRTLATTRASDNALLQSLSYFYDPSGNITHIVDAAQQIYYFSNQVAAPSMDYTYDALYRLIQASGRELIGLAAQPQATWDDTPRMGQALPSDLQAMQTYTEAYLYDTVGNILSLAHTAASGAWKRTYAYDEPNVPPTTNRLTSTTVGGTKEQPYLYDAHGNVMQMPHLSLMAWDFKDQLQETQQRIAAGPVEATYYVYDAAGQRVRKINESANGVRANERIYLGGYEVYREYDTSGSTTLERQTLHVMDDKRRVALVETNTIDTGVDQGTLPATTIRYQFDNHLGSACLELDENAAIISYEEYYPYGSTSYQAGPSATEVSLKRYRYTGKERDEESGFYYNGARYYAPWLGRWTACDPKGAVDGTNRYAYVQSNPIRLSDPTGTESDDDPSSSAPPPTPTAAQPRLDDSAKTSQKDAAPFDPATSTHSPLAGVMSTDSSSKPPEHPGAATPQNNLLTWTNSTGGPDAKIRQTEANVQTSVGSTQGRGGSPGSSKSGSAQAAIRYGLGSNADAGITLGGSTSSATAPDQGSRGWQMGATAHWGTTPDKRLESGVGLQLSATMTLSPPGNLHPSGTGALTGEYELKLAKSDDTKNETTLDANITLAGTGSTQTNSGVNLSQSQSASGLVSLSQSWQKTDSIAAEARFDIQRGTTEPGAGTTPQTAITDRYGLGVSYSHQTGDTQKGAGPVLGVGVNVLEEHTTAPGINTTNTSVFLNVNAAFRFF